MLDIDCTLDTSNLEALLKSLSPRRRKRVVDNSLRSVAAKARKKTQEIAAASFATRPRAGKPRKKGANARAWGRKASPRKDVAKGVQSFVYTKKCGFKLYVYNGDNYKTAVMHTNRSGQTKPVLMYNELGSYKSGNRTTRVGIGRKRANRGHLPAKGFMKKAGRIVDPNVSQKFQEILLTQTRQIAEKYGAKL